jgi:hypothetical protein
MLGSNGILRSDAGRGRPIRPGPSRAVAAAIHHKAAGCKVETLLLTSRFKVWRNLFDLLLVFFFGFAGVSCFAAR